MIDMAKKPDQGHVCHDVAAYHRQSHVLICVGYYCCVGMQKDLEGSLSCSCQTTCDMPTATPPYVAHIANPSCDSTWLLPVPKQSAQPVGLFVGVAGKVHEGMMSAATFVHCNTAEALQSAAQTYPGWPLVITGHSMGGTHTCTHVLVASIKHWDQHF